MKKQPKRLAYLVSVKVTAEPIRVYAVLAGMPDEALKAVVLVVATQAEVEVVGGLSREISKRMRLKLGEPHLV